MDNIKNRSRKGNVHAQNFATATMFLRRCAEIQRLFLFKAIMGPS